jgi:hypothetical protein
MTVMHAPAYAKLHRYGWHARNTLVARGPLGTSVQASPSRVIEVPLLQPAPLPGLSARLKGLGDWLHRYRLMGFPSPDVVRWSAASG